MHVQFSPVDRPARAPSRAQSARPNVDRLRAFAAAAQSNPGSPQDIRSFSTLAQIKVVQASGLQFGPDTSETHVLRLLIPGSTASIAAGAALGGANKTATARPLPRRSRAPSEIRYTLRPSAALDKELRRSKTSRAVPHARARLQRQGKAVRKLQDGHAN